MASKTLACSFATGWNEVLECLPGIEEGSLLPGIEEGSLFFSHFCNARWCHLFYFLEYIYDIVHYIIKKQNKICWVVFEKLTMVNMGGKAMFRSEKESKGE